MTERAFSDHRQAALALLNGNHRLTRKSGGFLGQLAVDPSQLSEKQSHYLADLLKHANLPPMASGEGL